MNGAYAPPPRPFAGADTGRKIDLKTEYQLSLAVPLSKFTIHLFKRKSGYGIIDSAINTHLWR